MAEKFSIRKRLRSFVYAFNGLKILLKEEHNSRIHLVAAVLVLALGWFLKLSPIEWVLLAVAIGSVFTAELFNSALENLADFVSPEKQEKIKKAKDLAAAAVLVSAIVSVATACLIFLPKIYRYLQ